MKLSRLFAICGLFASAAGTLYAQGAGGTAPPPGHWVISYEWTGAFTVSGPKLNDNNVAVQSSWTVPWTRNADLCEVTNNYGGTFETKIIGDGTVTVVCTWTTTTGDPVPANVTL